MYMYILHCADLNTDCMVIHYPCCGLIYEPYHRMATHVYVCALVCVYTLVCIRIFMCVYKEEFPCLFSASWSNLLLYPYEYPLVCYSQVSTVRAFLTLIV